MSSEINKRIRSNDPTLLKLNFVHKPEEYFDPTEEQGFETFLQGLRENTHIEYVFFERHFVRNLPAGDYHRVLRAVGEIQSLTEVEIWSVRVPLSTLCKAMAKAPRLHRLAMGMVTLTEMVDCESLCGHPTLQFFNLSDFRFLESETNSLDSLWYALSRCPRLGIMEIASNQYHINPWTPQALGYLATSSSLYNISLLRLNLQSFEIASFLTALKSSNSSLRVLNIRNNKLGDPGCLALAEAVRAHGRLRELDMRDNKMSADGSRLVLPIMLLDRGEGGGKEDADQGSGSCRSRSSSLEKLNLASNVIRDDGARALADCLRRDGTNGGCQLKFLDVGRAGITDVGCQHLANALIKNTTLRSLTLGFNEMTGRSYLAFSSVLRRKNRTLTSLNIQCDRKRVDLDGCQAVLDMVTENYVLENVSTMLASGEVSSKETAYADRIRMFLRLNHAGRGKLLAQKGTKADWVSALVLVQDSLEAIFYLVSTNPLYCQCEKEK